MRLMDLFVYVCMRFEWRNTRDEIPTHGQCGKRSSAYVCCSFFFSFGLVIVLKQTTQSQNKNRSQRQREEEKKEKKHGRKRSAFTLHTCTYTYTHTLTQTCALFLSQREIGLISIYTNTNVFFGLFSVVRLLS